MLENKKQNKYIMEEKRKLYKKAWLFNYKNYKKTLKKSIRTIEKLVRKEAYKGNYHCVLTSSEGRNEDHSLNIIVFRWMLRYSKLKPTIKYQDIGRVKGKRYIDTLSIEFDWDLSNGHID